MNPGEEGALTAPWRRVFLGITAFLLVFLLFLAYLIYGGGDREQEWFERAQRHASLRTDRNALAFLNEAFEKTDWKALEKNSDALRRVALSGWSAGDEPIAELLARHGPAISAVSQAAETNDVSFPPTVGEPLLAPRPNLPALTQFTFLLVANARRLQQEGKEEEAIWRLLDVMRFGVMFTRPRAEASLTSHLVGITAIEIALNAAIPLIEAPDLPPRLRALAATRLLQLEESYNPVTEALAAEAELFGRETTARLSSAQQLRVAMQYYGHEVSLPEAQALAAPYRENPPLLVRQQEELWAEIFRLVSTPYPVQPRIDTAWFERRAPQPLLTRQFTEVSSLLVRERVLLAKLRLARWRCVLLSPSAQREGPPGDPFSLSDLQQSGSALYSIGPDAVDQQGRTIYSPRNGTWSAGDVVLGPEENTPPTGP